MNNIKIFIILKLEKHMYKDLLKKYYSELNLIENHIKTNTNMLKFYKDKFEVENETNSKILQQGQQFQKKYNRIKMANIFLLAACGASLAFGIAVNVLPAIVISSICGICAIGGFSRQREYSIAVKKMNKACECTKKMMQLQQDIIKKHENFIERAIAIKNELKMKINEMEAAQQKAGELNLGYNQLKQSCNECQR